MIYLCDEIVAMEYQVTITETLSRAEYVEASSAVEAEEHVRDRYSKCDIVLSDAHFVEREEEFALMGRRRREEIENISTYKSFRRKIADIVKAEDTQTDCFLMREDLPVEDLPFLE